MKRLGEPVWLDPRIAAHGQTGPLKEFPMKRVFAILAVVTVTLCGSAVAQGKGPHAGHHRGHRHGGLHPANGRHGHAHAQRRFQVYHGKHNRFWTQSRVDARFGGKVYLSPTGGAWYYYAPLDDRYYATVLWPKGVYAPSK
jgi:hypothetical protein